MSPDSNCNSFEKSLPLYQGFELHIHDADIKWKQKPIKIICHKIKSYASFKTFK